MDRIDGLPALVLLSGGLDSVAALHWSRWNAYEVRALSFRYGQLNQNAELAAAGRIASKRGIKHETLVLADAVKGFTALVAPEPGIAESGVSRANLPARNTIFLSCAAAYGARIWRDFAIVFSSTKDDAAFPDCRRAFVDAMNVAASAALDGVAKVRIATPWIDMTKADVLRWAMNSRSSLEDVRESVSCYRGTRCGECDPCRIRAAAFEKHHTKDGRAALPILVGGDPAREAKLKAGH